jgi:hypothetical protein
VAGSHPSHREAFQRRLSVVADLGDLHSRPMDVAEVKLAVNAFPVLVCVLTEPVSWTMNGAPTTATASAARVMFDRDSCSTSLKAHPARSQSAVRATIDDPGWVVICSTAPS